MSGSVLSLNLLDAHYLLPIVEVIVVLSLIPVAVELRRSKAGTVATSAECFGCSRGSINQLGSL